MEGLDLLSRLREEMAQRLGQQRYELWVGPHISIEWSDSTLRVGCPSKFEMQWLRRRLHDTLAACCRKVAGDEASIHYYVDSAQSSTPPVSSETSSSPAPAPTVSTENSAPTPEQTPQRHKPRGLQQLSTFRNFVVGKSNELAFRTAKAVAEQPGQYGPLLVFGPSGVGKTHLQYAVTQHLRCDGRRIRTLRLTSEQFTVEFLDALHRRALPGFRQKYRSIDVLLIDDIQFLARKKATLDELLYTIDTLHEQGRQVVLTSDRSPGDLQKISLELVSRISGGLAIPIEPPDFSIRLGIVRQIAAQRSVSIDDEIATLIATQVAGSARQLSGAINRLAATSLAHNQPITLDLARTTLAEFVQQNAPSVRLADIQRAICEVFDVEATSLKSSRKSRSIAEPRMLAMWLARKYTRAALGEIGEFFGRRSHSTVISAQRKIEGMVSQGAEISVADRPCHVEEAIRQVESVLRTA